jgi:putative pyruvate formate lyase activating enzyme
MVLNQLYNPCNLCPRTCGVDRLSGKIGFCGETAELRLATAVIHKGEEPPLVGTGGSGTIFVSGCNLGCSFCQNYQISQGNITSQEKVALHGGSVQSSQGFTRIGKAVSAEEFAGLCAALRGKGAENINIVTGSHAVPALIEGLIAARNIGVNLPVLWNSSGYDSIEALELLKDYIDIYLPDLKTLDSEIAAIFFNAPDYPKAAKASILKMCDNTRGKSKVIVRHLILPGYLDSTRSVLEWFADNIKTRALLSLMTQYTPVRRLPGSHASIQERKCQIPQRYLSAEEYKTVISWLEEFGIEDGFCQELVTGDEWLPDFKEINPFSSELSVPIWSSCS